MCGAEVVHYDLLAFWWRRCGCLKEKPKQSWLLKYWHPSVQTSAEIQGQQPLHHPGHDVTAAQPAGRLHAGHL